MLLLLMLLLLPLAGVLLLLLLLVVVALLLLLLLLLVSAAGKLVGRAKGAAVSHGSIVSILGGLRLQVCDFVLDSRVGRLKSSKEE